MTAGSSQVHHSGGDTRLLGAIRLDHSETIDPRKKPEQHFELYSVPSFPSRRPEIVKGRDIGSSKQTVVPGTVLVCKINPRINRVWVVGDHSPHPKIASTEWVPFFPSEQFDPRFLAYYMQQDAFRNYLASNVSGVGGSLMRVRPKVVDSFPVNLSPRDNQVAVVEALDSYFSRLDEVEAGLDRVQRNLKRYRASVLQAAVTGRLVPAEAELARAEGREYEPASELLKRILVERRKKWEESGRRGKYEEPAPQDSSNLPELPEGWCWASVDQLSVVVRGASPRPAGSPKYFGGCIPWITVGDLTNGTSPFLHSVKGSVTEAGKEASRFVEAGTLLLTNSGVTLGVPRITLIAGCINDGSVALLGVEEPLKLFLYYFLANQTQALRRINQGAAQPNLNTGIVKSIAAPLPPLPEQERISGEVQRLLSIGDETNHQIQLQTARLKKLRQAILQAAFAGTLTGQRQANGAAMIAAGISEVS